MKLTVLWPFGANRPILRSFGAGIGKSALIYPVSALHSIALGTANLGLVYYLQDYFNASPGEVGLIAALFSTAYFVGCFVFRPFSRLLLPRFSLLLSVALNAGFVMGILLSRRVAYVAVFNALFGFGVSLFWPPIMGWLSIGLEGKELGRALGRFNLSWSVGLIVSPYLAGLLTERDARLPLEFGIGLFATISLLVVTGSVLIRKVRNDRHREPHPRLGPTVKDASSILRFPACIGLVGAYIVMGIFSVVFPMHARTRLGLAESTIGLLLLLRAVATTLGFMVVGRIEIWHHRSAPMIGVQVLLAGGCLVLGFFDGVAAYLILFPAVGALIALAYSQSVFHGVSGSPQRAKRMAIHEALLVAGVVFGSSGGGFLYQTASVGTMYFVAAALLGAAALSQTIFVAIVHRRKG